MSRGVRLLRNTFFLALAQITNPLLSMVFVLLLARGLGAAGLGVYSTVLTFYAVFNLFSTMGLNELVVRDVAADRSRGRESFAALFWLGTAASIVLMVAMAGAAKLLRYDPAVFQSICIITLALPFYTVGMHCQALLQAFEKMEYCFLISFSETVWKVVFGVAALKAGFGILGVIVTVTLGSMFSCGIALSVVHRRLFPLEFRLPLSRVRYFLRQAATFLPLSVVVMIYWSTDILMLSKMRPAEDIGYYTSGYRLLTIAKGLANSYIMAVFPVLASMYLRSKTDFRSTCERSIKFLLVATVPVTLCISLFAKEILVLLYGADFAQAAPALRILIWPLVFFPVANILGNALLASHRQAIDLGINLAGAVVNIILNAVLIPMHGYTGAAEATFISIVFFVLLQAIAIQRVLFPLRYDRLAVKPALAAGIMIGVVAGTRWIHPIVAVTAGTASFFGALLALRYLDPDEWKLIRRLWEGKRRLVNFSGD
jgi:O-antigen/teichoic acid export membrane protein